MLTSSQSYLKRMLHGLSETSTSLPPSLPLPPQFYSISGYFCLRDYVHRESNDLSFQSKSSGNSICCCSCISGSRCLGQYQPGQKYLPSFIKSASTVLLGQIRAKAPRDGSGEIFFPQR
ncbi:hypothetical protein CEXT_360911 [Caerostris extrusa]|uniref:Uncharacterized protein n=1 Tax=Caerostris extrusa TaxID=172846 RepID=A0AAV4TY34_CAEEX|nr:hypothetical protein CEXT_360911 [Caerostris extrusa]